MRTGLAPELKRATLVQTEAAKPLEPKLPQHALVRLGTTRLRHTSWVTSIAFAPDDRTVASAGADGAVRFWDLATGEPAAKLPAIKESGPFREVIARSIAYSPDGSASAGDRPPQRAGSTLGPHDGKGTRPFPGP